jgi:DNA invertase Pin-like site-specific DNA recombinase
MGKTALAFIVSGSDKKSVSKQRTLLLRTVKRSVPHVSELLEHVTEAESLGLELSSSATAEFFEAILSSHAQLVAFESPARLSADAMTVDVVVVQLEHVGVEVLFAKSPATKKSDGKLRHALKMALSIERIFRQARIKIGRQANATAGGNHGGNPRYGTLPGEEGILHRIEELATKGGLGHTAIASLLNGEGVKPRRAEEWQPAVIANILGARRDARRRAASRKSSGQSNAR